MPINPHTLQVVKELTWDDVFPAAGVLALAWLATVLTQWAIRQSAERAPARFRLLILRLLPLSRLVIGLGAVAVIVPFFIEPQFHNIVAFTASIGLALAFAFKDYGSSLAAGLVTVIENPYQPGDWIEVDGAYGEVKSVGLRAVHIVTPDDTEVIIPHSRFWSSSIYNATSGNRSLLCVADFYLNPGHDAISACKRLTEIAETSSYRKPETPVVVIVLEKPWGTHYRLKAYVKESREQFLFITDLTVRGKQALLSMGIRFAQAMYAELPK
jgi:small conductance mechanosensitive channel